MNYPRHKRREDIGAYGSRNQSRKPNRVKEYSNVTSTVNCVAPPQQPAINCLSPLPQLSMDDTTVAGYSSRDARHKSSQFSEYSHHSSIKNHPTQERDDTSTAAYSSRSVFKQSSREYSVQPTQKKGYVKPQREERTVATDYKTRNRYKQQQSVQIPESLMQSFSSVSGMTDDRDSLAPSPPPQPQPQPYTSRIAANHKPNRLRGEVARLRSLAIQPLSPSSKSSSRKPHKDVYDVERTPYSPQRRPKHVADVDDVSICISPSQLAVETRLPDSSPHFDYVEVRHDPPNRRLMIPDLAQPEESSKSILDSPRMRDLRKQHQQRSAATDSFNACLRRAQHSRRCASNSRGAREEVSTNPGAREAAAAKSSAPTRHQSPARAAGVRHRSTGRTVVVNRGGLAAPSKPEPVSTAALAIQRAQRYRNSRERARMSVETPNASNATARARPRSRSPAPRASPEIASLTNGKRDANVNNMALELNDSDIFTDFHLVMMNSSSSDDSATTNTSSLSWRRKKLIGRKFKTISKSKPSHHNAIAKLVAQKKKNVHIPISQLCQYIVPIQTVARAFLAKLALKKRMKRIVLMQSLIRRWKHRTYFNKCKFVAVQMQASYRGWMGREQALNLHAMTYVAIELQACYRGSVARNALKHQDESAAKIQASWRGFWEYIAYGEKLDGAVRIQSIARMKRDRKLFLFILNARRNLEEQLQKEREEEASTKIQSFWRGTSRRLDYCNTVIDIVIVQSVVRRWSRTLRVEKMHTQRNAAIKLQSWMRGWSDYMDYMTVLSSVLMIQCFSRRMQAVNKLEQLRTERSQLEDASATRVAAQWRGFVERIKFFNILIDVILCQSAVRRYNGLQKLEMLKQEREETRHACASTIQRAWRDSHAREVRSNMLRLEMMEWSAATKIAATWRRFVCEDEYRLLVIDATTCQRVIRHFLATRRQNKAATQIQAMWRGFSGLRNYESFLYDTITCQRAIRHFLATRRQMHLENSSATSIQAIWRGFSLYREYMYLVYDVIACQCLIRRHIASKRVSELREERQHEENMHLIIFNMDVLSKTENASSITITSLMRRLVCERGYSEFKTAATICQSVIRQFLAVKRDAREQERAATLCQSAIRRKLAVVQVKGMRHTVMKENIFAEILLQSEAQHISAVKVANLWRRIAHERRLEIEATAATLIASNWRGYLARAVCVDILIGIILFQAQYRRCLATKKAEVLRWNRLVACVIKVQACWRRYYAIRQQKLEVCATTIQARWRCYTTVTRYTWLIYDIVLVQSLARRWVAYRRADELQEELYQLETESATKIQAIWRGYNEYRDFMILLGDVILCQSVVRRHFACAKFNARKQEWNNALSVLQIVYNMKRIGKIEEVSANQIARVWRKFKSTKPSELLATEQTQTAATEVTKVLPFLTQPKKVVTAWNDLMTRRSY